MEVLDKLNKDHLGTNIKEKQNQGQQQTPGKCLPNILISGVEHLMLKYDFISSCLTRLPGFMTVMYTDEGPGRNRASNLPKKQKRDFSYNFKRRKARTQLCFLDFKTEI